MTIDALDFLFTEQLFPYYDRRKVRFHAHRWQPIPTDLQNFSSAVLSNIISMMIEIFIFQLSNKVLPGYTWLLSTWNVANPTEELIF